MNKTVCFFVKIDDPGFLHRNEFYSQDIKTLEELGYNIKVATKLQEIDYKADFIYAWWWTWAFIPVFFSLILRKKIIITGVFDHYINDEPVDLYNRNYLHRKLILFSLRFCTANIVVSELEFSYIKRKLKYSKLFLNPLYVDHNQYYPSNDCKEQFLLTISWLSKENVRRKCILEVLDSFNMIKNKYPNLILKIVGKKGDGLKLILERIKKLSIEDRVVITGAVSKEDKIQLLQNCLVYIQPTRVEGFGLAIVEAMACGAPVITSNNGTVMEVTKNAALYVNPDKPIEIVNHLNKLISDNKYYHYVSSICHKASLCYTKENKKEVLKEIIKTII